jgi:hypothetical protein
MKELKKIIFSRIVRLLIIYLFFVYLFVFTVYLIIYLFAIQLLSCGSLVLKVLGYKPEGSGFETRWREILNLPNPFGRTGLWGLLSL